MTDDTRSFHPRCTNTTLDLKKTNPQTHGDHTLINENEFVEFIVILSATEDGRRQGPRGWNCRRSIENDLLRPSTQ